jgi:AcrR family transcriptional regulator
MPSQKPLLGRREQNKAEKWERIVGAAAILFAERGYEGTTTTEVARAAGIGTGSLFLYVPTKEHLLVAVFRDQVDGAWHLSAAGIDPSQPFQTQIEYLLFSVIDFCEQSPELLSMYVKVLPFVAGPLRAEAGESLRTHRRIMEDVIGVAIENGHLQRDVPIATLAANLDALFTHHLRRRVAGSTTATECRIEFSDSIELQLRGLILKAS